MLQKKILNMNQYFKKKFLKNCIHAILFALFQQFSGINAILTNLTSIFENANIDLKPAVASMIVSCANMLGTIFSTYFVEKLGRKLTWIISSFGLAIFLLLIWLDGIIKFWSTLPVISLFIYCLFFGLGFGPIPWLIVPELFPDSVRSTFVSIAATCNWVFAAIVTFIWPLMESGLGLAWSFFLYAMVCILSGVYGIFLMPETQHKESNENDNKVHNDGIVDPNDEKNDHLVDSESSDSFKQKESKNDEIPINANDQDNN